MKKRHGYVMRWSEQPAVAKNQTWGSWPSHQLSTTKLRQTDDDKPSQSFVSTTLVPRPPYSLVPRSLPGKVERGSGVLSDISCHMGWGLQCKECYIYILHPGLKFSDDLDCCKVWLTKAISFLKKLRTSCEVSFFYLQFSSKYDRLHHAYIIMRSRI